MERGLNKGLSGINLMHPNSPNYADWIDWSANITTSNTTGWSTFTNKMYMYKKLGNLVLLQVQLTGTSNSTSVTIPLPFSNIFGIDGLPAVKIIFITDNGTSQTGLVRVAQAKNMLCYKDVFGNSWTASGTKTCAINDLFYLTNE